MGPVLTGLREILEPSVSGAVSKLLGVVCCHLLLALLWSLRRKAKPPKTMTTTNIEITNFLSELLDISWPQNKKGSLDITWFFFHYVMIYDSALVTLSSPLKLISLHTIIERFE